MNIGIIGINCGHTLIGPGSGAVGLIQESEHTRLVGRALMELLEQAGIRVMDCTIDKAGSQAACLASVVQMANTQELDWFISIHFNASPSHQGQGAEVYTYKGRQYPDALAVCRNLERLGFRNRGVKAGTGLYVVRKTKAKAMLIEVCFCDNPEDVEIYNRVGAEEVAQAIFDALVVQGIRRKPVEQLTQLPQPPMGDIAARDWQERQIMLPSVVVAQAMKESAWGTSELAHQMSRAEFIEFVGEIAARDWQERQIMLPSVVVAQAMKESACGTSELAQRANALFGIKQNGWTGRVYYKDATEQNPDGSYRKDLSVPWRAYDSWEQSILDHNTYIATRKIGSQSEPNWKKVVGEIDYQQAVKYLQEAQYAYATSLTYQESLIRDYIEKENLTRFDRTKIDYLIDGGMRMKKKKVPSE